MSVPARPLTLIPVALRELAVARIVDITAGMRRVTLTGDRLGAFTAVDGTRWPAFGSPGFDDDIRLLFPYPGESEPVLPLVEDGRVTFAEGRRPIARAYTVRRHDPRGQELDVEIVLHGDGVASNWARTVEPGDRMHIAGPGKTRGPIPVGADRLLIAGDDTAVPAIARLLEELPGGARGRVFIDVEHVTHIQRLRGPAGVDITWLPRDVSAPSRPGALSAAVRAMAWADGAWFAWLAGERSEVRTIRRHLVGDRRMAVSAIDFTGYWKREAANGPRVQRP
ncbi:siderophore-interacting protein [Streptomyces clavuligerus]|uniref:Putative siderophore-interacting protein n=1 Tax=Streptomyces clavuligerus TaxID=1901 RepID=E2Q8E5_STRCL|nr:siderophore-interacting protein [Streptomyces clavuligerus]ANW21377.1 NADPH-dependent ferric siderophore reductase [Streptomyces clavuligerus]AXU16009.1 siderophore-interacting protein [Streptomyces clavuligerus]EFG05477.1 Putative siderophore-interacting protein [Streptomyces clavuligerus]QCS08788.1 siderophore-interacting protein [Streptomyces clavuligerus]QPJ91871.1 siderophore-interacting protein [Streptomyces clavuligerus]